MASARPGARAAQASEEQAPERTIRELGPGESGLAHGAMRALRPREQDEGEFARHVDGVLRSEGYRLVGVFLRDRPEAVAAAGFRVGHSLAWGRYLYVDDLSVSPPERRQGHGGALLEWMLAEARRLGCEQLHLDSGTGPERFDAHRLYHQHGFSISSHHFARAVPADAGAPARGV